MNHLPRDIIQEISNNLKPDEFYSMSKIYKLSENRYWRDKDDEIIPGDAIINGDLDSIKYFHSIGVKFDEISMNQACINGHLHIIKFFCSIGMECNHWDMIFAAAYNNLDVIKLLYEKNVKYTKHSFLYASKNGYVDVVKYFYMIDRNIIMENIDEALDDAILFGHYNMILFLNSINYRYSYCIALDAYLYKYVEKATQVCCQNSY